MKTLVLLTVPVYMHGSCAVLVKPRRPRMPCIIRAQSRGDSGCPCRACLTGRTCPGVIGGRFIVCIHQSRNGASTVTYSGAVGGGASANAFVASAPTTTWPWRAAKAQNVRAPAWSSAAAYVWSKVTDPFFEGEPLHTQRALRVPSGLTTYVQSKGRTLALGGRGIGSSNIC